MTSAQAPLPSIVRSHARPKPEQRYRDAQASSETRRKLCPSPDSGFLHGRSAPDLHNRAPPQNPNIGLAEIIRLRQPGSGHMLLGRVHQSKNSPEKIIISRYICPHLEVASQTLMADLRGIITSNIGLKGGRSVDARRSSEITNPTALAAGNLAGSRGEPVP